MRHLFKALRQWAAAIVVLAAMVVPAAAIENGTWRLEKDSRGHPSLEFIQSGKTIFSVGVGRAVGLWIAYPGPPQQDGAATITIQTSSRIWTVKGELTNDHTFNRGNEHASYFLQWDMGLSRPRPEFENLTRIYNKFIDSLVASKKIVIITKAGTLILPRIDVKDARKEMRI